MAKRAVLVGLNRYRIPGADLRGCVNDVMNMQTAFARYGYGVPATGKYDGTTMEVVTAFQRHFRPERVDGIADHSTISTLHALLASLPTDASNKAVAAT